MISTNTVKTKQLLNEPIELSIVADASKCCKVDFEKVFDQPCFLEQLRLEKIRAQRSKTALSLILITHDRSLASPLDLNALLKIIRGQIRETDVIGYVDKHTLGILVPYTDEIGAQKIRDKIVHSYINPQFVIATSTYPDQIFNSLAKNGCVSAEVLNIMLDNAISNSWLKLKAKRMVDILGAIALILAFSPMMLLAAIAVKLNSEGPIIFKQTRLGQKGKPFTFYKFRSMQVNNDDQIHRDYVFKLITGDALTINNGENEMPLFKLKSDPRITTVGRFIRKTSVDELPQLYNVLIGDMSLVGPRPPLAYEAEKYQSWHLRRILEMKPGITGLWQVEGRSRTGFDEAVRLDVRYLRTWSLLLDMKILFLTIKEVLQCRGAV